ncbi:MAG: undecaprenyl-diphosphate phosphatase [Clostridia bacterium]|nr:undecaprenyl-diphosphate phosphatase [Clostridia bacterium]
MSLLIAFILGLIQGIAEFLPISSSGHLTLVGKVFGLQNDIMLISVLLHFATLFAIIFTFRKYIWELIKHPFSKEAVNLYIATIPTILIVVFLKTYLNNFFENSKLLPFGFLFTAMLLLLTYLILGKKKEEQKVREMKKGSSLLMGFAQGLAVIPGISRAGTTICTGLLSGEQRKETTRFSFIMSIPIIIGSLIYELIFTDISGIATNIMIAPLIVSFLTAFIVGIFSIRIMLKVMGKAKYYWFSIYLFAIAIVSFFII